MTTVRVEGLEEFEEKIDQVRRDIQGGPMLNAMKKAALLVEGRAKVRAPVDTGRLRSSITHRVKERPLVGTVGSKVHYAPHVEYGTRPHWPPPGALTPWAPRHGMEEFVARRSIGTFGTSMMAMRKFGTKGYFYLKRALDDSRDKIHALFDQAMGRIVER